jgi:hypothetical protein
MQSASPPGQLSTPHCATSLRHMCGAQLALGDDGRQVPKPSHSFSGVIVAPTHVATAQTVAAA